MDISASGSTAIGGMTRDSSLTGQSNAVPFIVNYQANGLITWAKYYGTSANEITALRFKSDGSALFAVMGSVSYPFGLLNLIPTDGTVYKAFISA